MLEAPARKAYNILNSPFLGVFAFLGPDVLGSAHDSAAPGAVKPLGSRGVLVMGNRLLGSPGRSTAQCAGARVRRIGSSESHPIP